jgi:hypothetical protein
MRSVKPKKACRCEQMAHEDASKGLPCLARPAPLAKLERGRIWEEEDMARDPRSPLEEHLESITREFVRQIVVALRNASFADVAQLQVTSPPPPHVGRPGSTRTRVSASPSSSSSSARPPPAPHREQGATRQTADRRAELGERVVKALEKAGQALGVRALSSELGVAPDLLATPLLELRAAGRIAKHGDKRATTYSLP